MLIEELTNFFKNEEKWIKTTILNVAKTSKFNIVKNNPSGALELISELWFILSSQKNLDKMRDEKDVKGKINNTVNLLLNKKNSNFIRSLSVGKNDIVNKYINYYKTLNTLSFKEEEDSLVEKELKKRDMAHIRYQEEADKIDSIIYSLYYFKEKNSISKFAEHLDISRYCARMIIDEMNHILKKMIENGTSYYVEKENYLKEKKVLATKEKKVLKNEKGSKK